MNQQSWNYVRDLAEEMQNIPEDSIVSRTLFVDDHLKVVLFGFAPGQELSEHTAAHPAILHFIQGESDIILGDEEVQASSGTWVHMPANLPHSVQAKTSVIMLLLLLMN
ncbi:MAG: cupin domain-containing protein [Anaerolineales bacterium]|nr:cupin domain-containing protein [Anaerolineales bacterium]